MIDIKLALDSFATALASSVLPVPGGPYNSIPLGGVIPIRLNISGLDRGHSTDSIKCCFISSNPPISFQETFGISTKNSLIAEGSIPFLAFLKSSMVTSIFSKISTGIGFSRSISGRYLRSAFIAASLARAARSAPTKPYVISASSSKSTSSLIGIPRV